MKNDGVELMIYNPTTINLQRDTERWDFDDG